MTRQRWASRTVFILAAIGSAVGLGNVWRFPYLAGKYGGGAFLIPYLLAFIFIGVPLLILEVAIGQKMQQGMIGSFRKLHPAFGGLGWMAIASIFLIASYYTVVMAWCLIYGLNAFHLPWAEHPEPYFFEQVLHLSPDIQQLGGINWPIVAALLVIWIAIYGCIWQGPQSVGRVILYSVPLPAVILIILLIRAVTLPGFWTGWQLYLTPVWPVLLSPEVWTAACTQIFYTLSVATGVMVTYASYKEETDDIAKASWTTALINSAISLLAGFVVFAVLGYMAWQSDVPVATLAASGPGLAFVVFPEALSLMPLPRLFSGLFFLMFLSLGIDSAFSIIEAINATVLDDKPRANLAWVSFWVCLAAFFTGIIYTTNAGLYFLDIADHFVTSYNLVIIGILQAILGGWIYGADALRRYINAISDWQLGRWWNVSIQWVIPIILTILLATQLSVDLKTPYEDYPFWALSLGWAMVILPLVLFLSGVWLHTQKVLSQRVGDSK